MSICVRRPKSAALLLFLSSLVAAAAIFAPSAAAAVDVPFTGHSPRIDYEGTFTIEAFSVEDGQLVAVGTLSGGVFFVGGPCFDEEGNERPCHELLSSFSDVPFTWPVASVTGTCSTIEITLSRVDQPNVPFALASRTFFEPMTFELSGETGVACAAAKLSETGASPHALAALLTKLVK
jgi:hypothetical protein